MRRQRRIYGVFGLFLLACGPSKTPQPIDGPTLETVGDAPVTDESSSFGAGAPKGFLRPCQTLVAGQGLVEVSCAGHRVVEFRKPKSEGQVDDDLTALIEVLEGRFGPVDTTTSRTHIASAAVALAEFSGSEGVPKGLAVTVQNQQGQFWGLVCYQKDGELQRDFCQKAIATAAFSGGLAHTGAEAAQRLGGDRLQVPPGCHESPGREITCPRAKLSWSSNDTKSAEELAGETLASLKAGAEEEGYPFATEERSCRLFDQAARCQLVKIENPNEDEKIGFVLLTGGGQERLVVCRFAGDRPDPLPVPCSPSVTIGSKVAP